MSGRTVLSDVGSSHALEVKTTDTTVAGQAHFELSKTTSPLATAVVRANLANHILVSHTTSSVAVVVRPPVVAAAQVASTMGSSAVSGSVVHTARVPSTVTVASADTVRPSNSTGVVCIMPVALTGVRVSGSAPIARLPAPATDVRLPLQMLQAPRTSSTERSKLSGTVVTSFQPRPTIIGQAAHAAPSPLAAAVAATGVRTLLPISSNRPVALPIGRPPAVSIPGFTNWGSSVAASSSSPPTIQIAIRPSQTDTAAGQPAAAVTAVASTPLQLRYPPERMILSAVTSADARSVNYRPLAAELIVPSGLSASSSVSATALNTMPIVSVSGGAAQTQAINLVSKTKILLTHSSLQQKVSPSITSSHLSGVQPVALNLSQNARGRVPLLPYVIPSTLSAQSTAPAVPARHGPASGLSAQAQTSAMNFVTLARTALSSQAQSSVAPPRYKSVSASLSSSSVPLQSSSQGGTLLLGGNLLTSGAMLSVEGFGGRAAQQFDRSAQILQPVQRDYIPQIVTVPTGTRMVYDQQQQSTPVAVVGQAHRPTLVVSQHSSLQYTPGKVAQVVVMDPSRRAVQPAYVVDGGSLSSVIPSSSEPTSTASQTMLSPRPSILRKRTQDGSTPKKTTNLLHVINTGVESGTGSYVRPHAVTTSVPVSPFRPVDSSRDNSQSSTDTASLSGSTQGSCPPSAEKVKLEPMEIIENGVMSNGQIDVPRKKPRKQLLHANEEILPIPGFSTPGDDEVVHTESPEHHIARQKLRKQLEKVADDTDLHQEIAEYCDEDGVRFSMEDSRRRFPGGIVGSLHFGWKSRNNHFVSYNDLVTKDERRASVNELANSRRAHLRSSGWPVHYFADQLEQLRELECDVLERLKASVPEEASDVHQSITCSAADDDGVHAVRELALGNIQRCQQFVARLDEARSMLLSLTGTHKQRVADIISRHQSKRVVKKKERL